LATDAAGNVYLVTGPQGNQVSRLTPSGTLELVAGNGTLNTTLSGDDQQPALLASIGPLRDLQVGPDQSLYLLEHHGILASGEYFYHSRIRRLSHDGVLTTVVGGGTHAERDVLAPTYAGNWLATDIDWTNLRAFTVTSAGLYFSAAFGSYTSESSRLCQRAPDGLVSLLSSVGLGGHTTHLDAGPEGTLYTIQVMDGWVSSFAFLNTINPRDTLTNQLPGFLSQWASRNGGNFAGLAGLRLLPDRTLFVLVDLSTTAGVARYLVKCQMDANSCGTLAGGGVPTTGNGDLGAATAARLESGEGDLAISPDGTLYVAAAAYGQGRVRKIGPAFPGVSLSDLEVASEDSSEIYHFTRDGRHLRTIDAVTGQTLAQFSYDANGYLLHLTDLDGDVTTIERDTNSVPQTIIAPDGQRTTLRVNANGYLTKLTNPAGEIYQMEYTDDGLLTRFTTPRGHATTMQYDSLGRLVKEENPVGGGWTLSRTQTGTDFESSLTSAEHRTSRYLVDMLNDRDLKRVNTAPDGTQSVETSWSNGTTLRTQADGTVISQKHGPDPRFGMLSPVLSELKITLPSGLTGTVTTKREATLGTERDLSKPASLKTTVTVNGKSSKSVYTAVDKKVVSTSAAGRMTTELLEEKGRVSQTSVPTLEPVHYTYDTRGRLTQVSQGQGDELRTVTLTYDNAGEVNQLTDALGRAVSFAYDAAGRVTTQTLPDGRLILYSYDANGNVTSITPPSRPAHGFDYTAVDLQSLVCLKK
jgi:YD repeat-containing protein